MAVHAAWGSFTKRDFTATIAGICEGRSVWKLVISTTSSQLAPAFASVVAIASKVRV